MAAKDYTRRKFIKSNALTELGDFLGLGLLSIFLSGCEGEEFSKEQAPFIDIYRYLYYDGRHHEDLLAHQRTIGITTIILLRAGSPLNTSDTSATHYGNSNGPAGGVDDNHVSYEPAQEYPGEFFFGANEVPGLPDTVQKNDTYLKFGAKIIGESMFAVACDSPEMQEIYEIARTYNVPVLIQWQYEKHNFGFDRFDTTLEKYPDVNFIRHSQNLWANISKEFTEQAKHSYPQRQRVRHGGGTDQLLSRYPNIHEDFSQTSGLTCAHSE